MIWVLLILPFPLRGDRMIRRQDNIDVLVSVYRLQPVLAMMYFEFDAALKSVSVIGPTG